MAHSSGTSSGTSSTPSSSPVSGRSPGPDVVRALAMAGVVVMNYHGYLILRGGRDDGGFLYDLFDPWTGPLSTRFAATFVLTAGVGVTLMTRSSQDDPQRRNDMSWRLARRGLLLYGFGLAFDFIWSGTILPYYGALFVLAAVLHRLSSRWLVIIGTVAAVVGWAINWWMFERSLDGGNTDWLTNPGPRSPLGLLFDVFVNGTHPLFPWLAFFCAGIILGRHLGAGRPTPSQWRPATVAIGFGLVTAATFAGLAATGATSIELLSTHPFDRGLAYTASALGAALIAFALITAAADAFATTAVVRVLQSAGQLSLSVYVAHALVFNLLVDWVDVIDPAGIVTSLTFAVVIWLAATVAAVAYQRRFGRGPVETLYRALSGEQ